MSTIETGPETKPAKQRMPLRARLLIFFVAWAILALPVLFWRSSWFGRPLTSSQITEYLHDNEHPRHIQHALVQIGERISHARDRALAPASVAGPWYPDLVRLSDSKVEEIRNTDAWLMGQDPSRPEFHDALRKLIGDPAFAVRSNAALSLVSFGDPAGHDQILAMLKPLTITSLTSGTVAAVAKPGDPIRNGTMVLTLVTPGGSTEMRSPITGKLHSVAVRSGEQVQPGAALAIVDPGSEQVWEGLRALYFIGTKDDLALVRSFQSRADDLGDRIRQQSIETEKAILKRN